MPVFQIGLDDGRSLRIEADDQAAALAGVQHFQEQEKPSGVVAGFKHGMAGVAGGDASTANLAGVPTGTLDAAKASLEPANYKAAPLIREGGHWYNPMDYQPSSIPQIAAEMAPGMGQDLAAGWSAGKLMPGNPAMKAAAGLAGYGGSALLRTFGPGAHANADARTGVPNSPVETSDLTREAAKQAITLPLNMVGGQRLLPTSQIAGSVLGKLGKTIGIEGAVGAGTNLADQAATTAGSKNGLNIDGNEVATSAAARAIGGAVMASPKAAKEASANRKFSGYEATPETDAAAQAVATRRAEYADGKALVGPLGGTAVAARAANGAHADIHSELAAASQGETLSPANALTLQKINDGGLVTPRQVAQLAEEASPDTMHLAHQALISKQENARGNLTDDKYTGGIGGAMENLPIIRTPVKSAVTTSAAALAAGLGVHGAAAAIGAAAPAVLGSAAGTYGVGRMIDRLTGSRSPAQAFQERFGGTDTPTRLPGIAPPADDPFNPSAGPWGARVDAGPTGPTVTPPAAPEAPPQAPEISPVVQQLLQRKAVARMAKAEKSFVPPEEPPAPAPPAPPAVPDLGISPLHKKMIQAMLKQGLPPEPAPPAPTPEPAVPDLGISPIQRKMLQAQMRQPLPPTPEPQPAPAPVAPITPSAPAAPPPAPTAPASPAAPTIEQLINRMRATSAAKAAQNPAATPPGGITPPVTPPAPAPAPEPVVPPQVAPVVSTLKKLKGTGALKEATGPSEYMDPDTGEILSHTPLTKDQLYGRNMTHEQFARHEADAKIVSGELDPKNRDVYEGGVIHDRLSRERELQLLSQHEAAPDDTPLAKLLLQELHHTRREAEARSAIKFYTSHMSPGMRKASSHLMSRHGPFSQMWSK